MPPDILPPLPVTATAPTAATLPPLLPLQILDLPPALLEIGAPVNLAGPLQLTPQNNFLLNTEAGNIVFSLPQWRNNLALAQLLLSFIETGKPMPLQLVPTANGLTAALLTQAAQPAAQQPTPQQTQTAATPTSIIGKIVQALVLPQADNAMPTASAATPQNPARPAPDISDNLLRQAANFGQKFLNTLTGTETAALKSGLPASAAQTSLSSGDIKTLLSGFPQQQGQLLTLKIQQILAAQQSLPPLANGEFAATVTGLHPALEQPVAVAGRNAILIKTAAPLAPGSVLILKAVRADESDASETHAAQDWPALRQLLAEMHDLDPALRQAIFTNRLPQMNQTLPAAMLFLLGALHQGDLRAWLGEKNIAALERAGKKQAMDALREEFKQATETVRDSAVGQWRAYHLPWQDQAQLAPMHVYVHREGDGEKERAETGEKEKQTRFIIDVTFSRLGTLQLDGFVKQKNFDLMLRSEQPLQITLRHELQARFQDITSAAGFTGALLFQTGTQNWLRFARQTGTAIQA